MMSNVEGEREPALARTLSVKSRRRSLGKSRQHDGIKPSHSLSNPFAIKWPAISRQSAMEIIDTIATSFPSKEDADCSDIIQHLTEGFNATFEALSQGCLAAVLVEMETPELETKFLLPLASLCECAAVRLPRLRRTLQATAVFAGPVSVLGLKKCAADTQHRLHPVLNVVKRITVPSPVPALSERPTTKEAATIAETSSPTAVKRDGAVGRDKVSPIPLQTSDFISLSPGATPKSKARKNMKPYHESTEIEVDNFDSMFIIDKRGVPHKKRAKRN